jgi:hypothetical protein
MNNDKVSTVTDILDENTILSLFYSRLTRRSITMQGSCHHQNFVTKKTHHSKAADQRLHNGPQPRQRFGQAKHPQQTQEAKHHYREVLENGFRWGHFEEAHHYDEEIKPDERVKAESAKARNVTNERKGKKRTKKEKHKKNGPL